jgi:hypothetical protein
MSKQTAVEFLLEEVECRGIITKELKLAFEQAKAMEKGQIIDAFWNGDNSDCTSEQNSKEFAEQYYEEVYGDNK